MKLKTKYLILLATATGLNAVENEMPNVSHSVKKKLPITQKLVKLTNDY